MFIHLAVPPWLLLAPGVAAADLFRSSDIPANNTAVAGNAVGLYESGDAFSQDDVNLFLAKYASYVPQGTSPTVASVDGGVAPVAADSDYNTGESDIDIDIIMSLVYPQNITVYQVDDDPQLEEGISGFMNTFLDALDGSYCNYTAYGITGDSPGIDASYPDSQPGGYNETEMCGVYTPTNVISISYGEAELDLPENYIKRQCDEYMKLGLQGVTILIASGDYGVAGFPGDITDSGCLSGYNLTEAIYSPDSVSACPYVSSRPSTADPRSRPGLTAAIGHVGGSHPAAAQPDDQRPRVGHADGARRGAGPGVALLQLGRLLQLL